MQEPTSSSNQASPGGIVRLVASLGRVAAAGARLAGVTAASLLDRRFDGQRRSRALDAAVADRDEAQQRADDGRCLEAERRCRAVAEATSEGLVIHHRGQIIDGNSVVRRLFGLPETESIEGRSIFEFIAPESRETVRDRMESRDGGPYNAIAVRSDGTRFEAEARVRHAVWDGREVRIVALRDVTGARAVQRQLDLVSKSLEGAGDGVVIADPDGEIRYMNRMAGRLLGNLDDAGAATLAEWLGDARAHTLRTVLAEGGVWTDELLLTLENEEHNVRLRAVPVAEEHLRAFAVVFMADVTDLRDTEAALADREDQLAELLESLPEFVWSYDHVSGTFHYLSSAVENICGVERAGFRDDPGVWRRLVHPDDQPRVYEVMDRLEQDGSYEMEYRLQRDNGSVCWVYDSRRIDRDAQGEVVRSSGIAIDITERKQQELALKVQAEQMQTIMDHAPVLIARFDRELRHLFVNSRVETMAGLPAEAFIGKTNPELGFAPEITRFWERELREVFETGEPRRIEFEHETDHGILHLEALAAPETVVDGEVQTILSFTRDVTQRVAVERRLAQQERFYRTVLERSFDAVAVLDEAGEPIFMNRALRELLGVDAPSGKVDVLKGVAPGDRIFARRVLVRLLREPAVTQSGEIRWYRSDECVRVLSFKATNYLNDPDVQGVIVVMRDATEEQRLERAVLSASDTERQRIGQDLHDGLGQHLTGVALMAKTLNRRLLAEGHDAFAGAAAEIEQHVNHIIRETRFLVHGMSPVELERYGLVGALRGLISSATKATEMTCRFESDVEAVAVDDEVATHLYRIAQEAVANAMRHSGANLLVVRLQEEPRALMLRIQDDGCGMAYEEVRGQLGLRSMAYRARLIGARFSVQSRAEMGTTIQCRLPKQPAFAFDARAL